MSVASSKTLLSVTPKDGLPIDVLDMVIGHTIGQVIHDSVEAALDGYTFRSLMPSWDSVVALAGVSKTCRAIVLKLVALAFRIPLPCEAPRLFSEGYQAFRSLILLCAATCAGAVMDAPQVWQSPLMHAYAHYSKVRFFAYKPRCSVISLLSRKGEISRALELCSRTVEELSQPLVNSLLRELENDPGMNSYIELIPDTYIGLL
ncbi:hypothetical protein FB45DRAFT_940751 [Roridomyces roridus]|uniref:Uncharacterized protein n=1 Tax=Roridomyces roridus TaxID=1738132 RepID=A0AAD7B5Y8_9AGAR|nr:hypothetical protein FB45DRAFT_940751 [Roridomyces roridus]